MNTSEKKKWSRWRQNNFEFFEKNLKNIRHNDIVVDIGCGEGQFKAFFNNVKKYIGIDFQEFPGVTTLITDLTKPIPLESDLADIVFISNVLEHIPTPEALIAEAHRLLKDDGMIIGTVPYIRDVHQAPYDFLRYTHFMLEKMFTDAGFKDIEITPIGTPFDVYQVVQDIYFAKSMDHTKGAMRLRLARKSIYLLTKLFTPILRTCPSLKDFAEGYGFKGYKV